MSRTFRKFRENKFQAIMKHVNDRYLEINSYFLFYNDYGWYDNSLEKLALQYSKLFRDGSLGVYPKPFRPKFKEYRQKYRMLLIKALKNDEIELNPKFKKLSIIEYKD